jgi:RNA polymerase sigma-70 factor (ECF subfamily)
MSDSRKQQFAAIVQPHFAALYRAALRLTRQRQDAEDLLQEVCVRAYTCVDELAAAQSPRAWLLRAEYHLFVDLARRRARSPFVTAVDGAELAESTASTTAGPERIVDAELGQERIAVVWQGLDADQRALLALHAEGHGLDELADILGIAKNAVSARLHRARQRLAKLLGAQAGGQPALNLLTGEP